MHTVKSKKKDKHIEPCIFLSIYDPLNDLPDTLYSRSPSNCTELYLILQLSSNSPLSNSGSSNSIAVLAYILMIL